MPESYTPRELINKINEGNNGPVFDPYGTEALRSRMHVKQLEAGNIFAEAQQGLIQEAEDIQKAKETEIQKAQEDLATFKDYLENQGYFNWTIQEKLGELEVYFDEEAGSAVIARPDRMPFELDLSTEPEHYQTHYSLSRTKLKGKLSLPKQLLISSLNCSNNELTILPAILPASLTKLDCTHNGLKSLPAKLPTGLTTLICNGNQLGSLPELPAGLVELDCTHNGLESLPDNLPIGLTKLNCASNFITELPRLPAGIRDVDCSNNRLYPGAKRVLREQQSVAKFVLRV